MALPKIIQKLFSDAGKGTKLNSEIIPPLKDKTSEELSTFIGEKGEITYNTTEKRIVAHDGATKGGIPLAKKAELESTKAEIQSQVNEIVASAGDAKKADILEAANSVTDVQASQEETTIAKLQAAVAALESIVATKFDASDIATIAKWNTPNYAKAVALSAPPYASSPFTAPSNGVLFVAANCKSSDVYAYINGTRFSAIMFEYSSSPYGYFSLPLPLAKGDTVYFDYKFSDTKGVQFVPYYGEY